MSARIRRRLYPWSMWKGLVAMVAVVCVLTACGSASQRTLYHWDGNSSPSTSFGISVPTNVTVSAEMCEGHPVATTDPGPGCHPSCAVRITLESDGGTSDPVTVTAASSAKALVLTPGNWHFALGSPADQDALAVQACGDNPPLSVDVVSQ